MATTHPKVRWSKKIGTPQTLCNSGCLDLFVTGAHLGNRCNVWCRATCEASGERARVAGTIIDNSTNGATAEPANSATALLLLPRATPSFIGFGGVCGGDARRGGGDSGGPLDAASASHSIVQTQNCRFTLSKLAI